MQNLLLQCGQEIKKGRRNKASKLAYRKATRRAQSPLLRTNYINLLHRAPPLPHPSTPGRHTAESPSSSPLYSTPLPITSNESISFFSWLGLNSDTAASGNATGDPGSPRSAILCCKLLNNFRYHLLISKKSIPLTSPNGWIPCRKTRIWLGTFESAKDAARAYDEAARLMCGPRTRTNFPYNPDTSPSSCSTLSPALTEKLHRFNLVSAKHANYPKEAPRKALPPPVAEKRTDVVVGQESENGDNEMQFSYLEEHHIEQMIEELFDSNLSIELCCTPIC